MLFGVSESGNAVLGYQPCVFVIDALTVGSSRTPGTLGQKCSSLNKKGPEQCQGPAHS
jgi:hypothetical protein